MTPPATGVMTPAEWALIFGALGAALTALAGVVVSLVQARNSAKKADLDSYVATTRAHAEQDEKEFQHLVSEIARLEKSLDRRREEYEQLWKEVQVLRLENVALRAENVKLKERVVELEKTTKPGTGPLSRVGS